MNNQNKDEGSFGWAILGFFFPLVGLILFLCWVNEKKTSAKQVGLGALVGFLLKLLLSIIAFFGFFSILFSLILGEVKDIEDDCVQTYGENYKTTIVDGISYCKNIDTNELILQEEKEPKKKKVIEFNIKEER